MALVFLKATHRVAVTKRPYAYDFPDIEVETAHTYSFEAPMHVVRGGADLKLEHRFGLLKRAHRTTECKVAMTTNLRVPERIVSVSERGAFNRFLAALRRQSELRAFAAPQ